jgi:long-chain acyl-CoA synthetase
MNVFDTIRAENAGRLESVAVVDGERRVSYGELFALVDRVAGELRTCDIGPAQRVAVLCNDSIEHIVISLAALSVGAAIVPVSPSHSLDEVKVVLREIDVAVLIFERDLLDLDDAHPMLSADLGGKTLYLHRRAAREDLPGEYYALNPAVIRFSSGTTGSSKGVVLSHETILDRTDAADRALNMSPDDRAIWVLSMSYHFVVSILLFLRRGVTIVLCCRQFLSSLVDGLSRYEGTFIYASPFHYRLMTNSAVFSAEMFSNIRLALSTAMRLPEVDACKFHDKFGVRLAQAYGIIEVGLPFVNCSGEASKQISVGSVLPDYEARIVGPDAEGVGEVHVRGKGMFDAYLSPWQGRDRALSDGWFKTGDLGRIDSDGFLFLSGREKNVINFAGMKVFPGEVEAVLNQHPDVRESLVYGTDHDVYGELPCADIVPRRDTEAGKLETTEIRRFCYQYLAPYKVPKEFRCVPRLDKTASGKLKRW